MSLRNGLDAVVLGGGGFGTTLAHLLAEQGRRVLLWVRREEAAREIGRAHRCERYLPGFHLSSRLRATTDLAGAVRQAPVVLVAVPSRSMRDVARLLGDTMEGDQIVVHATKGIEIGTGLRMSEILRRETCALKIGALSGPNLSHEIMAGKPAGAVIASRFEEVTRAVQGLFAGTRFRVYAGADVIGAEIGGAFKNIVALAAGAADGMDLGANAKALMVTRGLAEMQRYGTALGADPMTFQGLAGIGDLMATCFSPLSRNRSLGERLARGETVEAALAGLTQVAEAVPTCLAVHQQAVQMGLELHVVQAVHGVLYEGVTPAEALRELTARPAGREGTGASR